MNRFFLVKRSRRIHASWQMYPLGLLFGLGFDTATEVGLLAIAAGVATHQVPFLAILSSRSAPRARTAVARRDLFFRLSEEAA